MAKLLFTCVLTGAPDGLADLTLPMSNLQARRRSGDPSYLQVSIPNHSAYAAGVTARPNGELIIYSGDGESMPELMRANLESITVSRGAVSQTISLTGHKTTTNSTPQTRTLTGVLFSSTGTGKARYRAILSADIQPGDTADIIELSEQIVVGMISYLVDRNQATMELTEA